MPGNSQTVNLMAGAMAQAISDTSGSSGNNIRIDSRGSTWMGNPSGGVVGDHAYYFTANRNELDILAGGVPLALVAGANVSPNAAGDGFVKSIAGNSWNSYFYSSDVFDPLVEDFAVSVKVESVTGTIREMIGLDESAAGGASYTTLEYAAYQVNGNFYRNVYQGSGLATGAGDVALSVGDRIGVKCISGVVTYFVQSGGVITDVYESLRPAVNPVQFKAVLNRGNTSSGASEVGDCRGHRELIGSPVTVGIFGAYNAPVVQSDIDKLALVGLDVVPGCLYSDLAMIKQVNSIFPAGVVRDFTHAYSVNTVNDSGSI